MAKSGEFVVSVDVLQQILDDINTIDERIAATSGSEAGNVAVRNSLVRDYQEESVTLAQPVVEALGQYSGAALVGMLYGVIKAVEDAASEEADEALKAVIEERRTKVEPLSDEEMEKVIEDRKQLLASFNTLKTTLSLFGFKEQVDKIPAPRSRLGAPGKRGPTVWGKFQYSINGKPVDEELNTLAYVAKRAGMSVADFKSLMGANNIDIKKIDKTPSWELAVNSDLTVSATALPQFASDFTTEETDENAVEGGEADLI